MGSSSIKYQDIDEEVLYLIDWTLDLSETSTTIDTSSWILDSGLTNKGDSKTTAGTSILLDIDADVEAGQTLEAVNRIVTADGQTLEHKLIIKTTD